jgi:hypothetical protein
VTAYRAGSGGGGNRARPVRKTRSPSFSGHPRSADPEPAALQHCNSPLSIGALSCVPGAQFIRVLEPGTPGAGKLCLPPAIVTPAPRPAYLGPARASSAPEGEQRRSVSSPRNSKKRARQRQPRLPGGPDANGRGGRRRTHVHTGLPRHSPGAGAADAGPRGEALRSHVRRRARRSRPSAQRQTDRCPAGQQVRATPCRRSRSSSA